MGPTRELIEGFLEVQEEDRERAKQDFLDRAAIAAMAAIIQVEGAHELTIHEIADDAARHAHALWAALHGEET